MKTAGAVITLIAALFIAIGVWIIVANRGEPTWQASLNLNFGKALTGFAGAALIVGFLMFLYGRARARRVKRPLQADNGWTRDFSETDLHAGEARAPAAGCEFTVA